MPKFAHRLILITASLCLSASASAAFAQDTLALKPASAAFKHLDVGVSVGTTGLGIHAATPLTPWMSVRAGLSYVPRFNIPMTFGLETFDAEGVNTGKFEHLQELLRDEMGISIDDAVDMNAKCTMLDFKLLLDFYPLPRNRHWRLTAGFYWGASRIGHIENDIKDAPTLVGVTIYNHMYEYFVNETYLDQPIFGETWIDPDMGDQMRDRFLGYGRMGVHLGDFKSSGNPYIMEPDEDCMVKANAYVNHFKPYLGAGYETTFGKDNKWKFSTDLGVLFWGGTPAIKTHANLNMEDNPVVNLSKDVTDIHGKVGDYVRFVKALKVYPSLNFSISYSIF